MSAENYGYLVSANFGRERMRESRLFYSKREAENYLRIRKKENAYGNRANPRVVKATKSEYNQAVSGKVGGNYFNDFANFVYQKIYKV